MPITTTMRSIFPKYAFLSPSENVRDLKFSKQVYSVVILILLMSHAIKKFMIFKQTKQVQNNLERNLPNVVGSRYGTCNLSNKKLIRFDDVKLIMFGNSTLILG